MVFQYMFVLLLSCSLSEDAATPPSPSAGDTAVAGDPADSWMESIDAAALPQASSPCREPVLVAVTYVVDGDTFYAQAPAREEKIRVIGINTPELGYQDDPADCLAEESRSRAEDLLSERRVWLTFDQECEDAYGRTLAYVHLGDDERDFFERIMLQEGMARAYPFDSTPTFSDLFQQDESAAQAEGAGGWSACGWQ